jgi:putative lipoic acid-binding regulatory protein
MRALLDNSQQWPGEYTFKFIVPKDQLLETHALFGGEKTQDRQSSNGRYVGVSITKVMDSADAVLEIYDKARAIPGLIAL